MPAQRATAKQHLSLFHWKRSRRSNEGVSPWEPTGPAGGSLLLLIWFGERETAAAVIHFQSCQFLSACVTVSDETGPSRITLPYVSQLNHCSPLLLSYMLGCFRHWSIHVLHQSPDSLAAERRVLAVLLRRTGGLQSVPAHRHHSWV